MPLGPYLLSRQEYATDGTDMHAKSHVGIIIHHLQEVKIFHQGAYTKD